MYARVSAKLPTPFFVSEQNANLLNDFTTTSMGSLAENWVRLWYSKALNVVPDFVLEQKARN